YVTGWTTDGFHTTHSLESYGGGRYTAFVAKIDPHLAGENQLIYSTYLSGNHEDEGWGVAADAEGSAYVIGETNSTNFLPVNALQATLHGRSSAFVAKVSADGNQLLYSTYLGGSNFDRVRASGTIAVDAMG